MLAHDAREDAMANDRETDGGGVVTFAAGLLIGAALGAGVTLLVAPSSGEEMRRLLTRRARRLADDAQDRYEEARYRVRRARERRRREHDKVSGD
jgi:gas vesicle protein